MSGVSVTTATAGIDTSPPVKNPYNNAKAMVPPRLVMPIQTKMSIPDIVAAGVRTLSGPILSVTKFGMIRPATDAAL